MAFVCSEQLVLLAKDGVHKADARTLCTRGDLKHCLYHDVAMQNPAKAFIRMRHTQRDAIEAKKPCGQM